MTEHPSVPCQSNGQDRLSLREAREQVATIPFEYIVVQKSQHPAFEARSVERRLKRAGAFNFGARSMWRVSLVSASVTPTRPTSFRATILTVKATSGSRPWTVRPIENEATGSASASAGTNQAQMLSKNSTTRSHPRAHQRCNPTTSVDSDWFPRDANAVSVDDPHV